MPDSCDLKSKKCVPCEGGVDPLTDEQARGLLEQLPHWKLVGKEIHREYQFKDFKAAMAFVNGVAEIAETEGHHPDILIYQYKKVRVTLWTHAIGGLSENDFIVAAKIDSGIPVSA